MAAGKYSFTIEQGATVDFEIACKDSNGDPIDLTGYQARMQLRPGPGSNPLYITLSSSLDACGTGLNMSGSSGLNPPTSGTIGIYISAISSSQLNFDIASYDLEIASGSGNCYIVTRLLEGKVKLSKEITQGSF
jgi:hypothetical protein